MRLSGPGSPQFYQGNWTGYIQIDQVDEEAHKKLLDKCKNALLGIENPFVLEELESIFTQFKAEKIDPKKGFNEFFKDKNIPPSIMALITKYLI